MDHSRCRLDVGCCRDSTRSLLWSHSECLEDLWDSFVAIKVLWTRGPAVSGTLSWLKSFYFVILDVSSRNPVVGWTLLKHGGSRMLASSSVCLANDLCTSSVKQQYFSVPGLGEYRRVPWKLVEARNLGNLERHVASASSRAKDLEPGIRNLESRTRNPEGGGAAVFPTLRQGSFRGTTPVEFDKYSKAFISRSSSLDSSSLWNSSKFLEGLMASRACWIAASWLPTDLMLVTTAGIGTKEAVPEPCGTVEGVWVYSCILQWGLRTYPSVRDQAESSVLGGTWPEKMIDMSVCCSEHDVSRCFSEHGGTLLMSWRSWPEPPLLGVSKKKVFYVWNLALAAIKLMSSDDGRRGPPSLGRINHSAWKPEAGGRDPDPGGGTQNLEAGNRNLELGTWKPKAGVISSWNIFPQQGSGFYLQLSASRPSDLSCLRINGNLPLIRLIPAVINQMKIYGHCSTSTTLLTGSGHDLQLISRIPPCSLKHIDTLCSLQRIDRSTICFGHVPSKTDDSYPLQSYTLPRQRAH
ncbi:hypothetical protein YC2023_010970 [Brassica napus]